MKSLFLVESSADITTVEQFVQSKDIKDYLIFPVSTIDPYFYDCFDSEKLVSWQNNLWVETRSYQWIFDFKQNEIQIKNFIPQEIKNLPYYQSLMFYLTLRFGNEYTVFVDMFGAIIDKYNISKVFLKQNSSIYVNYILETQLIRSIEIDVYG